ncbi:hypothetical protein CHRY9393_00967 [Chryseobacterium fistulae]|uniref:Uncharacterized protein n=1 Tax=Chryseobacterium fistulae TaxID=2675058 RepID=A0A6N4XTQ3_9FLAO|nr:hypothetical protein CHRY9393_00967 [Chryseobacterium fistulae]
MNRVAKVKNINDLHRLKNKPQNRYILLYVINAL